VGRGLLREQAAKFQSTCAKCSDTSATTTMAWLAPEAPEVAKLACLPKPRRILAPLFDFGKERLETLAPRVFIFGQPGLEQTQKTKSVVHT